MTNACISIGRLCCVAAGGGGREYTPTDSVMLDECHALLDGVSSVRQPGLRAVAVANANVPAGYHGAVRVLVCLYHPACAAAALGKPAHAADSAQALRRLEQHRHDLCPFNTGVYRTETSSMY